MHPTSVNNFAAVKRITLKYNGETFYTRHKISQFRSYEILYAMHHVGDSPAAIMAFLVQDDKENIEKNILRRQNLTLKRRELPVAC